ncbi:hypothetical protein QOZ80_4AG0310140 [Eleusine coracana subsp. coracana]|nr:hypothetical protein QOZ80_4AG0310140 [Eleusine coracana subsp. coracana]
MEHNESPSGNKQEELEHRSKQDNEKARVEEYRRLIDLKLALRLSNLNPDRPDCTIVGEAVSYICEAKLRSTDIQAAVQICSLLHQRYADFSPCLIQGLLKVFFLGKSVESDPDKNARAMKKRSTLRLLIELYFVGIVEDASTFTAIIKELTSLEHLKDRETTQTNISLLANFARQGRFFLGLQPEEDAYDDFFMGLNISSDQKRFFKKALCAYYDAATEILQSEHASLRAMESENAKILSAKGELSDENTAFLAEALDMQPPVMPEDGHTTRVTTGSDFIPEKESSAVQPIWDDEDTKSFYESLPDLRAFVPAVLLGLGEAEAKLVEQHGKVQEQSNECTLQPETDIQNNGETSVLKHQLEGKANGDINKENEEKEKADQEKYEGKVVDRKGDGASLDSLLQKLPRCVSRDLIDKLTVEFCYLNSKANRKKLARALFTVPRTALELLPYHLWRIFQVCYCQCLKKSLIF